jgi:hypothetical protein
VRYCEVFSTSVFFDGGYVKVLGFSSTSVVLDGEYVEVSIV